MKKTTLFLFGYALSVNFVKYLNVNAIVFFIFTMCLGIVCNTLLERFVIRKIKEETEEDHLTTLKNKRAYAKKKEYFNSCDSIGVMFFDINNLKTTNDTFGHGAGDELISSVANVIKNHTREGVFAYRFGGDEFVVIFTNIMKEQFMKFNEMLLADFDEIKLQLSTLGVSVAAGGNYEDGIIDIERILEEADTNMYEVKRKMKQKNEKNCLIWQA